MSIKQYVLEFLNGEKMIKATQEGEPEMAKQHQAATIVEFQDGGPSDFRKVMPKAPSMPAGNLFKEFFMDSDPNGSPMAQNSDSGYLDAPASTTSQIWDINQSWTGTQLPSISKPVPNLLDYLTIVPPLFVPLAPSSSSSPPSSLPPPENFATSSAPAPGV
ncbi:hypothetical protein L3Y34_019378 [Caenorhabditis briggsae]|uniref:Uncharacterized protein n=1 Tax=Caenorhabditis briggsae TaxID=6238 RepID=A0AAE9IWL4_CAEBR|nr:hypothetical protein L3Y34_019378 [Caenorhabditis briggsae]